MEKRLKYTLQKVLADSQVAVKSIEKLNGNSEKTYEVNGTHIVKFPWSNTQIEKFKNMAQVLCVIKAFVDLPTPAYKYKEIPYEEGKDADSLILNQRKIVVGIYPKIEGVVIPESTFRHLEDKKRHAILTEQALFIKQMHDIPIGDMYGVIDSVCLDNMDLFIQDALPTLNQESESFQQKLKRGVMTAAGNICDFVVSHDDTHIRNFVLTPDKGALAGVIDFSETTIKSRWYEKGACIESPDDVVFFNKQYEKLSGKKVADFKPKPSLRDTVFVLTQETFHKMKGR